MIIYWTIWKLVSFNLSLEKKLRFTFWGLYPKETDSTLGDSSLVHTSQHHLPQDHIPSSLPGCTCKVRYYQKGSGVLWTYNAFFL